MSGKMEDLMKMKLEFDKMSSELGPLINSSGAVSRLLDSQQRAQDMEARLASIARNNDELMK